MDNNSATMTKEELTKLLKSNIKAFNQHREETGYAPIDLSEQKFQGCTLTGARLQNTDFSNSDFEYANLLSANLSGCNLTSASFHFSNLSMANLTDSTMENTDFTGSQLEKAELKSAILTNATFSKANLTEANLDLADMTGANFSQANLAGANLKTVKNIKQCIFDKFTRWPDNHLLPANFQQNRPGSTKQPEQQRPGQPSQHQGGLTPEQLKSKMVDKVELTGMGLPELERHQRLMDKKLDYVVASIKNLTEKMAMISGGDKSEGSYDSYGSSYETGSSNEVTRKLQDIEDKIENVSSFLTRFPVKSLEETYKLTDVITNIEKTQNDITQKLTDSIKEINDAKREINSIMTGQLKASYIDGLDKMFESAIQSMREALDKSTKYIIDESKNIEVQLDETVIRKELETQITQSMNVLKQELDRKLGTHGLFLKQMDEKVESLKAQTDFGSVIQDLKQDIEYKTGELKEVTKDNTEKQEVRINNLLVKLKVLDEKIDILSETSALTSISNMISEFGSGFIDELNQLRDASIAIDNRLKGLTGEADLSNDFAIDSIAKAVNINLGATISQALSEADRTSDSSMLNTIESLKQQINDLQAIFPDLSIDTLNDIKEGNHSLNDKLSLLEKEISKLNQEITGSSIVKEVNSLEYTAKEVSNDIKRIGDLPVHESEKAINDLKQKLVLLNKQASSMAKQDGAGEYSDKIGKIENISSILAEKIESMARNIGDNIDITEQIAGIREDETFEILDEFSEEIDELKEFIKSSSAITESSIKAQATANEDAINNLREELTASIDRLTEIITGAESDTLALNKVDGLHVAASQLDSQIKNIENLDQDQSEDALKNIKQNIDSIIEQSETMSDNEKSPELDSKVDHLKGISDLLSEKIANMAQNIGDNIDISQQLSSIQEDGTMEILNEVAAEIDDIRDFIKTSSAMTTDEILKQSKTNEFAINNLREELCATLDRMMSLLTGMETGSIGNSGIQGIQGSVSSGNIGTDGVIDEAKITDKLEKIIDIIESKADILEQKVDILVQTDTDSIEEISDLLMDFKDEIVGELSGQDIAATNNSKALDLSRKLDLLNDEIISISEKFDSESLLTSIREIIESGIALDREVIIDNIAHELDNKFSEEGLRISIEDLTLKVESICNEYTNLSDSIESKLEILKSIDPSEELANITENLESIKDESNQLKNKIQEIQTEFTKEAFGEIIYNLEGSIKADIENLNSITSKIDDKFTMLEGSLNPEESNKLIQEILELSSNSKLKLDDLLTTTESIDSNSITEKIREHLDTLISDIGSNLGSKNDIIEDKINTLIELESNKNVEVIINSLEEIKEISDRLNIKIDKVYEKVEIDDLINELTDKIDEAPTREDSIKVINTINEAFNNLSEKLSAKASEIEAKIELVDPDELTEAIDNITADLSLIRKTANKLTEQVNVAVNNTDNVLSEEGLISFKEDLESKLSNLIESGESNFSKISTNIECELNSKLEDYYKTTKHYISEMLNKIEESINNSKSGSIQVTDFIDSADEKIWDIHKMVKEISTRVENIQEYSETTLITKDDIEDLFTNINTITITINEKIYSLFEKLESQFAEAEIDKIKDLKNELEIKIENISNVSESVKAKLDEVKKDDDTIENRLDVVVQYILDALEEVSNKITYESRKIEKFIESTTSSDEVVTQIDTLISDVLVGLDQKVNSINQVSNIINKRGTLVEAKIETVSELVDKIFDEGVKIKEKEQAFESLVEFMKKDADQKLALMKDMIDKSGVQSPAISEEINEKIKKLESQLDKKSKTQNEKLKKALTSIQGVLEGIEDFKNLSSNNDE